MKLLSTTPETLNVPDHDGQAALHRAGSVNITAEQVKMLLALGARINQQDNERSTPLHHAIEGNQKQMVQALLEHQDVNVNAQDVLERTPLHVGEQFFYLSVFLLSPHPTLTFVTWQRWKEETYGISGRC